MISLIAWIVLQAMASQSFATKPAKAPAGIIYRIPKGEKATNVSGDPLDKTCNPKRDQ